MAERRTLCPFTPLWASIASLWERSECPQQSAGAFIKADSLTVCFLGLAFRNRTVSSRPISCNSGTLPPLMPDRV